MSLDIATRLAAALLLQDGRLSLSEIEALPFVEGYEDALTIARRLLQAFDAEETQRHVPGSQGVWETVIELRSQPIMPTRPRPVHQSGKVARDQFNGSLRKVSRPATGY
jgi:hypothetical protein